MIVQGALFDPPAAYPDAPGFKKRETSRKAAEGMAAKAPSLRERVLAAIRKQPGTPEEIAARLKVPVMNVRPRCSELAAKDLIVDSGERREAMGGRQAIVWTVKTDDEAPRIDVHVQLGAEVEARRRAEARALEEANTFRGGEARRRRPRR